MLGFGLLTVGEVQTATENEYKEANEYQCGNKLHRFILPFADTRPGLLIFLSTALVIA